MIRGGCFCGAIRYEIDDGEYLVLVNAGACLNAQCDGAAGWCVECRAHGRDHTPLHRNIPNEVPSYHFGNAQPVIGHRGRST